MTGPRTHAMLRWFEYERLPPDLQNISSRFWILAHGLAEDLPDGPELTAGLRKLLEAKDCCVRAAIAARADQ